jgi:phospholipid/cholesterol/gamma-HCH transport system substrate-binding protein
MRRRGSYEQRRRRDVAWGTAALLVVTFAVYVIFGGGVPGLGGGGYEVRAVMHDAGELRPGSPVRMAGVDVGAVERVERGPGATALLTMRLADDIRPVRADATLKVRPRLFLEGNFFAELTAGSPSAPPLEDGGTIPLAQTALPVQLDQVLSALEVDGREQLQVVLRELGRSLDRGGGRALGRGIDELGPALRPWTVTVSALRGLEDRDLSQTVAHVARVAGALDARRRELAGVIDGFDRTAGALAAEEQALSATVRGLAATLREAPPAVRALRAAVPPTRAFARDVRPLLRRAPATLDLLRPLLAELRPLLAPGALPALTRALRPPLRELAALQPGLEELLDRVTPVTDCVRDHALPVLSTPVEDGHLSTGRPPWQELLSALVGLAGASANFDGNGHAVRYMAGFGEQLVSTGRLPVLGTLHGLAPAPFEGARPAPPATQPPFRPHAPCREQAKVDLTAASSGPPPAARPASSRRGGR